MQRNLLLTVFCLLVTQEIFSQCGTTVTGTIIFCGTGCDGDATFTSTGGTPPYDLVITGGPTVQYSSSYTWTNICPGTYPYTVTDATLSCTDNGTLTIVGNPNPVVVVTPSPAIVCMGDSVLLFAAGAISYNWSPSSSLNSSISSSVYAFPNATTTYTVVGVDANGCTGSATVTVNVNPLPLFNPGPGPSYCSGGSVVISLSGAATYLWSPATGLSSTTGSTVTANPTVTTTYNIVGTSVDGCISASTITVTVYPFPSIKFNFTNCSCTSCCDGSITAISSGAATYSWSNSAVTVSQSNLCTGTYTVSVTDANGCYSTNSATIGAGTCSSAFSVYPNTSVPHDYWVVNTSTGTPPISYLWTWGDATSDTGATPTHTYASEGFYDICLSITDGAGCSCMNCWSANLARMEAVNTMITVSVVPSIPTGTSAGDDEEIVLYPNPAENQSAIYSGQLAISFVEIYDVLGEKVFSRKPGADSGQQKIYFDVGALNNGIYFMKVTTDEGEKTAKLIVQH